MNEELLKKIVEHPAWKKQVEEFARICNERPCAVCDSQEHTAFEGHSAESRAVTHCQDCEECFVHDEHCEECLYLQRQAGLVV